MVMVLSKGLGKGLTGLELPARDRKSSPPPLVFKINKGGRNNRAHQAKQGMHQIFLSLYYKLCNAFLIDLYLS